MARMAFWGCAAVFIVASLVYGFGTADPIVLRWTVLACATAVAVAWGLWWCARKREIGGGLALLALVAFFAYTASSLLWSPDPRNGLDQLWKFGAVIVAFIVAASASRERLLEFVSTVPPIAVAILAALVFVWPQYDGGAGNPNFLAWAWKVEIVTDWVF